jgi:hypothetical protein
MLRSFDFQVNLSTDQERINAVEVTAQMTGKPEDEPWGDGPEVGFWGLGTINALVVSE